MLNDELHHAVVVEYGKKSGDEDDGWQNLKSKIETQVRALFAKIAKNERRSGKGIAQQAIYRVTSFLEHNAANIRFQHKNGKSYLQAQSPGDCLHANRASVCREGERQAQHG